MKTEPPLSRSALAETLRQEYTLTIANIEFLPTFWAAYCYRVTADSGEQFFLKLVAPGGFVPYCVSDPAFYLPLTYQLHARGILPHIAYPIPACDGRFWLVADGYRLILFNYIDGHTVGCDEWPAGLSTRLAGLLGRLHRCRPRIRLDYALRDQFALPFENDLLHGLNRLENVPATDRQGIRDLRDLLLPRKREMLEILARLKELQNYAIAADKPRVICHTDLHGNNLMRDACDHLYIIDWEGAILAPPEQDLFFFVGNDDFWQSFLPAYKKEFGPVQLDSAIFGFYGYRRNLEDLADWVVRILDYNTTAEQDAEDLQGIQDDCLAGWPYLEKASWDIEAKLTAR